MIHATVIGNLGADPEQRVTAGGKAVCNFRIAAKGSDKNAEAMWVRCALWGARGETVAPYLVKGGRVAVSGTLSTSEYNGKMQLNLDVAELELLGDKLPATPQVAPPRRQHQGGPAGRAQESFGNDDGEIPF
jgi:single-strand DNA-binding protein